LFGLSAQLSAHGTDEQTFEGLKDIGLLVKYGEVDGQPAEWQATALQSLEDRARQRLQEAGIHVLSIDESITAGRAKLVFTVTLNTLSSAAAPVRVQTKLYQECVCGGIRQRKWNCRPGPWVAWGRS